MSEKYVFIYSGNRYNDDGIMIPLETFANITKDLYKGSYSEGQGVTSADSNPLLRIIDKDDIDCAIAEQKLRE